MRNITRELSCLALDLDLGHASNIGLFNEEELLTLVLALTPNIQALHTENFLQHPYLSHVLGNTNYPRLNMPSYESRIAVLEWTWGIQTRVDSEEDAESSGLAMFSRIVRLPNLED